MTGAPRVRKDVTKLSQDELNILLRAWKGIQELDPDLEKSFFKIAGYHGMPFRGAGWGNSQWWGGYCHHGNILFPTWHRAYLYCIEEALRSIKGCEDVTIPYWNEPASSDKPGATVVPEIFTMPKVQLDGQEVDNPLYSYKFQKKLVDHLSVDVNSANPYDYSKPGAAKEYSTVRYPQSGLVGSDVDLKATTVHNDIWCDLKTNTEKLNANVSMWLSQPTFINDKGETVRVTKEIDAGTRKKYNICLDAPNYTVFSNTTSAKAWNDNVDRDEDIVVPLEAPHNDIHLAVGGFEIPSYDRDQISGAQGDMGENDTASFDPIFYFHHCWIDNVFWQWQQSHGDATKTLCVLDSYPGTNSIDSQGATPGIAGGSWLTLQTPLQPFKKPGNDPTQPYYISDDVVDIEAQLGYTYENAAPIKEVLGAVPKASVVAHVTGVNKSDIRGSFNIAVFGTIAGKRQLLGQEAILSRWHMAGCANCQLHTAVRRYIPLHGVTHEHVDDPNFNETVEVLTRGKGAGVKAGVELAPKVIIIKKTV